MASILERLGLRNGAASSTDTDTPAPPPADTDTPAAPPPDIEAIAADVSLAPFYRVHRQRYAVYWRLTDRATYDAERRQGAVKSRN